MNIKKLKLVKLKGGYGLTLFYDEINPADATDAEDGLKNKKALVHNDLFVAVQALAIHYAVLMDYVPYDKVEIAAPDPLLTDKFYVSGYSIGGDDENHGIMISAHKTTHRKKAANANSPFEVFECAPEVRYQLMDDLLAKLRVIEHEVDKYLSGEKRGEAKKEMPPVDENQGDLFQQKSEVINKAQILPDESAAGRKDIGTRREKKTHIPQADAEAQRRVKEGDNDGLPGADKAGSTGQPGKGSKNGGKRVTQSADHPDGIKKEKGAVE